MKHFTVTLPKPEQQAINEDASYSSENLIAVSDGAGGGGVYAEKWSSYLVGHLPNEPFEIFEQLDLWIDSIWEKFYNDCEELAKMQGGLLLDKFYDEGSFATLVSVWKVSDSTCKWISYGDSVAFHYNTVTQKLEHSFSALANFDKPPYLINCKDPLNCKGFHSGTFHIDENSIVFCASDALSFYIILLYELARCGDFYNDLQMLEKANSKNSEHLKSALYQKVKFKESLIKLLNCRTKINFERHLTRLLNQNLISLDDYSIAVLPYNIIRK